MKEQKRIKILPSIEGLCIDDLTRNEPGYITGRMRIGRAWFHVSFYEVKVTRKCLVPTGGPNVMTNYFRAETIDPDARFTTMKLPGVSGRWVMVIHPYGE